MASFVKLKYFLQEMWYLSPAVFPGIPSAWMLGEFMLGWVQLVDWFGLDGSIGLVGLGWVGLGCVLIVGGFAYGGV